MENTKKQRLYKWFYVLLISFVAVTLLRETGQISLNSYQHEGSGSTIGGGVKGTIPPHQIRSGTLFFHAMPSSAEVESDLLKGIYEDLENRPATYRPQGKTSNWGWEYPESIAGYLEIQKQQAQARADYASGKYQVKKEDVDYFIFPKPTPIQVQFEILKCTNLGFFAIPLYKKVRADYRVKIIFPNTNLKSSVVIAGNYQLTLKGFCSAHEARNLLSKNIARNIRRSAVNTYWTNYQQPTKKSP
jgi:hypothetical protein